MSLRAAYLLSRSRWSIAILGGVLSLLSLGCKAADSSDSKDPTPDDQPPGDPTVLAGTFQVRLVPPSPATGGRAETPGYTSVVGKVFDGPTPSSIVWRSAASEGDCQLLTPRVPFCNSPCGGSAACVEDDVCQAYAVAHSAGKVTVTGLHTASDDGSFVMDPIANSYQPLAGVKLAYPAFSEGDKISFKAAGDYFSAFTLEAKGISPLELSAQTIQLEPEKAVTLTWANEAEAGASKIHVKLDISHHGGTKGMIECDADDKGSIELPAALVTELLTLGVAGFPTIIVNRSSTGSTTIAPGRVDLVISSEVERSVQIAGLTSCSGNGECPNGQVCQTDLTCK